MGSWATSWWGGGHLADGRRHLDESRGQVPQAGRHAPKLKDKVDETEAQIVRSLGEVAHIVRQIDIGGRELDE